MIAIIVSDFYKEYSDKMLEAAKKKVMEEGLTVKYILRSKGAFDSFYLLDKALNDKGVKGAVVLGCVIKGETKHDEVIVNSLAEKILDLTERHGKPVSFGIIGPGASKEQAEARLEKYAERAVSALKKNLNEAKKVK